MSSTECKAKNPSTCRYHGTNIGTIGEKLQAAASRKDFDTYASVRRELVGAIADLDEGEIAKLTTSLDSSAEVMEEVTRAAHFIARNPNTNPQTLDVLSAHPDVDIRVKVALHQNASPEALLRLSADSDEGVRRMITRNASAPAEALAAVAPEYTGFTDGDQQEGSNNIAAHPNASEGTLQELVKNEELHFAIVRNPSASTEVLRTIAERIFTGSLPGHVFDAILSHKNAPKEFLPRQY